MITVEAREGFVRPNVADGLIVYPQHALTVCPVKGNVTVVYGQTAGSVSSGQDNV